MKCKHCDGVGFFENGASQFKCVYCDGTGEVEMTNEEWFNTLTAEEKAETIAQLSSYGGNVEAILLWLKQPHHKGVIKNEVS